MWSGSRSSAKIERTPVEARSSASTYIPPRGAGAATQLMVASLRCLANLGLDPVVVWTHPGAGRAQSFYVKSGFRATGRSRVETLGSGIDDRSSSLCTLAAPDGAAKGLP